MLIYIIMSPGIQSQRISKIHPLVNGFAVEDERIFDFCRCPTDNSLKFNGCRLISTDFPLVL
jgi:hypothetical protein